MPAAALALTPLSWREHAAEQDGVVGRRQARLGGLSEDAWQWRLHTGRWQSVLPGVAVTHSGQVTACQQAWAAVVYAGAGAALSADAALIAQGMTLSSPTVLHLAIPTRRRVVAQAFPSAVRESAVRVVPHRVAGLTTLVHPARTPPVLRLAPAVLHAAAWAPTDRAGEWRVAAAVQQRLVRPADLRSALTRMTRLPRRALIATVLDDVELGAHAASELDFLRLLRRHRLPPPDRLQRPMRSGKQRYLDGWWERQRVVAEVDGSHHRSVGSWDEDTLRANEVMLAERGRGVVLLRFTTGNLRHDEARVAELLRAALL